jgi:HK97 family phage major capsid protein
MTRTIFEDWIAEEWNSTVYELIRQTSVVETAARQYSMGTDTMHIPRSGEVSVGTVGKGVNYGVDTSTNDEVLLSTRKFGTIIEIADEDITDSHIGLVQQKREDWATGYAKFIDNACLGTSNVENAGTVPFTSVYRSLTTSNAQTGYSANDNLVVTASGHPTYDELSEVLNKIEVGDYFDEGQTMLVAHPSLKHSLRQVKDNQGRPIFVENIETGMGGARATATLFGYPIMFSLGARVNATATPRPTGNSLLIAGNRNFLALGMRSGPEFYVAGPHTGVKFESDQALLKMRSRRGFTIGHEKAFSILEVDN